MNNWIISLLFAAVAIFAVIDCNEDEGLKGIFQRLRPSNRQSQPVNSGKSQCFYNECESDSDYREDDRRIHLGFDVDLQRHRGRYHRHRTTRYPDNNNHRMVTINPDIYPHPTWKPDDRRYTFPPQPY